MMIALAIIGAITAIVIAFIYFTIKSDLFIRRYCLMLFKQKQHSLLKEIGADPKIIESKDGNLSALTEVLQDILWKKSKKLDDNISNQVFDLETVVDIAYIAWFIFFIHKNHDVSKSS